MDETENSNLEHYIEQYIPLIHKTTAITAATLYLASTLLVVTTNPDHTLVAIARLVLYNAGIMLMLAETARIIKNWEHRTRFSLGVFGLEMFGYCILTIAACREEHYNHGVLFMIASFLISISKQLDIVMLLVPKNRINEKRYLFLSSLNSCCSALVFFFAALISNFLVQQPNTIFIRPSLNIVSGILMALSVFYTVKDEHYQGYTNIKLSMSD